MNVHVNENELLNVHILHMWFAYVKVVKTLKFEGINFFLKSSKNVPFLVPDLFREVKNNFPLDKENALVNLDAIMFINLIKLNNKAG